ncbi:hypothetical protein Tco_0978166 [Tanacetum coccineum]|uniref:Uncharacterized protein n=1 Tax=Tanacetum coccineum TaxID=301880 RepID=A0ABQ5EM63_9ASTR
MLEYFTSNGLIESAVTTCLFVSFDYPLIVLITKETLPYRVLWSINDRMINVSKMMNEAKRHFQQTSLDVVGCEHAVATASAQNDNGSLEAESIVRAAHKVRFRLSTMSFYSGVRGVEV